MTSSLRSGRYLVSIILIGMSLVMAACDATLTETATTSPTPPGTDTTTGTVTTTTTPAPGTTPAPTATTGSGGTPLSQLTVYVGSDNNTFYGMNAADGSKQWSYALGDVANKPSVVNGVVYGTTYGGEVFALHTNGSLIWHTTPGSGTQSRPAVDPGAGLVFIGAEDNTIYALKMSDGSVAWHYATGGNITGSLYYENNLVFSGSEDGYLYALHESSGTLAWRTAIAAVEYASPTGDGTNIYIGADDGHVFAYNESSGAFVWKYQTGGQILAKPAIFNGILYIGSNDDNEYAIKTSDGTKVWQYGLPDSVGTAVLTHGYVIVGSSDGTVIALTQTSGHVGWTQHIGGNARTWFTTTQNVVYTGSTDGHLYAFDVDTGHQDFKVTIGGVVGNPTVG